jgi:urea carboxylase
MQCMRDEMNGQIIKSADDSEVTIILEAMKTEINIPAGEEDVGKAVKGLLGKGIRRKGASVQAGDSSA